jgi:hypothetical protein
MPLTIHSILNVSSQCRVLAPRNIGSPGYLRTVIENWFQSSLRRAAFPIWLLTYVSGVFQPHVGLGGNNNAWGKIVFATF